MKTLILFIALSLNIFAQNSLLILMSSDPTVASIDTIPSQFTFTDVTDAALSSYNQAYIVVAGCDSARFYPASGDTIRAGALGTKTVSPIWLDLGDTLFTFNVASASNSTATHSIIYSSNGIPLDTFSVTTVASGIFNPTDLNPILYLVHDDSVVASGSGTVVSWTDNGFTFTEADTTVAPIQTDSSIFFGTTAGNRELLLADAGGNPFDILLGDMSVEAWVYYLGNAQTGRIMAKGQLNDAFWTLSTGRYDDLTTPVFSMANTDQSVVGTLKLDTGLPDSIAGGWHHLVATLDRNVGAVLYVDSVLKVTETTEWTNFSAISINTGEYAVIGQTNLGHIAVIRFYNTVLTPTQVKQLYEFGRE